MRWGWISLASRDRAVKDNGDVHMELPRLSRREVHDLQRVRLLLRQLLSCKVLHFDASVWECAGGIPRLDTRSPVRKLGRFK